MILQLLYTITRHDGYHKLVTYIIVIAIQSYDIARLLN